MYHTTSDMNKLPVRFSIKSLSAFVTIALLSFSTCSMAQLQIIEGENNYRLESQDQTWYDIYGNITFNGDLHFRNLHANTSDVVIRGVDNSKIVAASYSMVEGSIINTSSTILADNHSVDIYTDMDLLTSKASNIYPGTTLGVELLNDAHFTLHNRLLAGDLEICSTVENNHKNQLATFESDVDLHGNLNIRDTNASFNGSITFLDEIRNNSQYHGIPAITISGNSNVIINRANITNSIHGKLQNSSSYFANNRAAIILTNSDKLINDQEEDNRSANISFEYDTINIDNVTTAEAWDTKPTSLSGFLVKAQWKSPDQQRQHFVVNINGTNLNISNVKGSPALEVNDASGIRFENITDVTFNSSALIENINGSDKASGIEIANVTKGKFNNPYINISNVVADDASGIRLENITDVSFNSSALIENINGSDKASGIEIANVTKGEFNNPYINISNVVADDAYGIFLDQTSGPITFGKQNSTSNISINGVSGNSNSFGIYSGTNSLVNFKSNVIINGVGESESNFGVMGSNIIFDGGLTVDTPNTSAIMSAGGNFAGTNGIIVNGGRNINCIKGGVVTSGSNLDAHFENESSYLEGYAIAYLNSDDPQDEGTPLDNLSLNFSNSGYWNVTNDSRLTNLTLSKKGRLSFFGTDTAIVKTDKLVLNDGILEFKIDFGQKDETGVELADKVIAKETAEGTFTAILDIRNADQFDYVTNKSVAALIEQGGGTMTITDVKAKPGAAKAFYLRFFEHESAEGTQVSNSLTGGQWHVVSGPAPTEPETSKPESSLPDNPTNPSDKPSVTPEVDQILSLGGSLSQSLGMLSETEDLRMRMGDVRHGDTDGLWVRTYSRKDSARGSFGNGFEQDVHGFHIGADHVIRSNDNASWLVGGAFHYGKSDIEGAAEAGGGDADIDQYTFKAYATYMKDNGAFADIVLHTGYYDTTLTGKDNTGMGSFKGDYSNWGYGVSAEVGHRIDLSHIANSWYIEPTAQLTWFHAEGKNFKTSTGLEINQGDANFITGRLGATVGKVYALGTSNDPMSSYFSVAMKGGMLYQFDGDQTITAHGTDGATVVCADAMDMKGARAYYGITADWKIDDTWRVYGQISREEGSGYTKDYDASIGVRYAF